MNGDIGVAVSPLNILSYLSSSQLYIVGSSSSISISIGIGISISVSSSILVSYNLSRSNEPLLPVPKRKIRLEEEKPGGSEHQPSFILFI